MPVDTATPDGVPVSMAFTLSGLVLFQCDIAMESQTTHASRYQNNRNFSTHAPLRITSVSSLLYKHRVVGKGHQGVHRGRVDRVDGYTDTGADTYRAVVDVIGPRQRYTDLTGHRRSRIAAVNTTQDNGELIAAHPGHGVNLTQ